MDDLWGEELSDDIIEECLLVASQVEASILRSAPNSSTVPTSNTSSKHPTNNERQGQPFSRKSDDGFVVPQPRKSFESSATSTRSTGSSSASDSGLEELVRLRSENQRLQEENTARGGETSILRADIQKLQLSLHKKEQELSSRIQQLHNEMKEKEALNERNAETLQTEIKFKDLEIEELRTKCKRLEHEHRAQAQPVTSTPKPTSSPPKFLNKAAFDADMYTPIRRNKRLSEPRAHTEHEPANPQRDLEPRQVTLRVPQEDWNELSKEVGSELAAATHRKDKSFSRGHCLGRITQRIIENPGDFASSNDIQSLMQVVCSYLRSRLVPEEFQNCVLIDFLTVCVSRVLDDKDECKPLLRTVLDSLHGVLESECTLYIPSVVQLLCAVIELRWSALCTYPKGCLLRDCVRLLQSKMDKSSSRELMVSIVILTETLLTSDADHYAEAHCRCAYQSILLFSGAVEKVISPRNGPFFSETLLKQSLHLVLTLLSLPESEPLSAVIKRRNVRSELLHLLDCYGPDLETTGTDLAKKGLLCKYLGYRRSSGTGQ